MGDDQSTTRRSRGQQHPRASLSDSEVDLLRDLYEQDMHKPRGERYWTAARLAEKFDISPRGVFYIVAYQRRVPAE